MLTLVLAAVLATTAPASARIHGCAEDAAPLRRQIVAVRAQLLAGVPEDQVEAIDVVEPLRACFRTHIMPALVRAESDHTQAIPAAEQFFAWGREAALLAGVELFDAEFDQGVESLIKGVRNAFRVARDRCIRLNDTKQVTVMLELARYGAMRSFEVADDAGADLAACMAGRAYLIEVRQTSRSANYGVGSEWRYLAYLSRDPDDPDSFVGRGVYGGFLTARGNCRNGQDRPERFDVSGKVEATAAILDMSADPAKPDPHMIYTLASLDFPLKPMFGGDSPFAETAEEKEGVKGMATTTSVTPVRLTGAVTNFEQSAQGRIDNCAGQMSNTTTVRIRKLARR